MHKIGTQQLRWTWEVIGSSVQAKRQRSWAEAAGLHPNHISKHFAVLSVAHCPDSHYATQTQITAWRSSRWSWDTAGSWCRGTQCDTGHYHVAWPGPSFTSARIELCRDLWPHLLERSDHSRIMTGFRPPRDSLTEVTLISARPDPVHVLHSCIGARRWPWWKPRRAEPVMLRLKSKYFKADPQTTKPSQVTVLQWPELLTSGVRNAASRWKCIRSRVNKNPETKKKKKRNKWK